MDNRNSQAETRDQTQNSASLTEEQILEQYEDIITNPENLSIGMEV